MNLISDEYLCSLTEADLSQQLEIEKKKCFTGILGSIDCMNLTWKHFPTAYGSHYTATEKDPTIILGDVESCNTWIWNVIFGLHTQWSSCSQLISSSQRPSQCSFSLSKIQGQFKWVHHALLSVWFDLYKMSHLNSNNQLSKWWEGGILFKTSRRGLQGIQ